ncbi:hypothetical protein [Nocardia sp. NPDC057440]|uniref:hypothetical protein n=1 Tax=Nocardia sp. NPDC057440 TaxID=3346134 RepID=UPI00366B1AC8
MTLDVSCYVEVEAVKGNSEGVSVGRDRWWGLTLEYVDGRPVLRATGGSMAPLAVEMVDEAGKPFAVYLAGKIVEGPPQADAAPEVRWEPMLGNTGQPWNKPWVPFFVEWQVEYYSIGFAEGSAESSDSWRFE